MAKLVFQTLGHFSVTLASRPIPRLRNKKALALLVYLAYHAGRPFLRTHLQGLLWSETDAKRASSSLRQALSGLQKALPPNTLSLSSGQVSFSDECDFEMDALGLAEDPTGYSGVFMADFDVKGAQGWEDWLSAERESIEAEVIAQLERLAQAAHKTGQFNVAITHLQRILEISNWREDTHTQLMIAYWATGDRAAALKQFEQCQAILDDELGVEPAAETQALFERIRSGAPFAHTNLPDSSSQTPFFGRVSELLTIQKLLDAPTCRLLTLVGLGGTGKTRLAIAAARRRQTRYLDGVWLVELDDITHPSRIAAAIATAIGFNFSGHAAPRSQLLNYLADKQLLLVLDNFEHLLSAATLITTILDRARQVVLVVTSRVRLNLRVEQVFQVGGLPIPSLEATGNERSNSAVQLFVSHAQRVDHTFEADETQLADVIRVCELLEGLPLGLELAASWVRMMDVAAIVREIERELAFLSAIQRDVPDRQRSLMAVFEYSWELLTAEEQRIISQLAFFLGGFDHSAFKAVIDGSLFALVKLVDKSLVQRQDGNRYRLHARLRQFLHTKQRSNSRQLAARHSNHYLSLLTKRQAQLHAGNIERQNSALASLTLEVENIRLGWRTALAVQKIDSLVEAIDTMSLFYELKGWFKEGTALFEAGVAALSTAEDGTATHLLQAKFALAAGVFNRHLDNYTQVRRYLDEGLALAQAGSHDKLTAHILVESAIAGAIQSQFDTSRQAVQMALALNEALNDRSLAARCHNTLFIINFLNGQYDAAQMAVEKSYRLFKALGHERAIMTQLDNLGMAARTRGQYGRALRFHQDALQLNEQADNLRGKAYARNNIGVIKLALGQFEAAYEDFERSLRDFRIIGDAFGRGALALVNLGEAACALGQLETAERHLHTALAICRESHIPRGEADALAELGRVARMAGRFSDAHSHLAEGLEIAEKYKIASAERMITAQFGFLHWAQGDYELAEVAFTHCLQLSLASGEAYRATQAQIGLALVAFGRGRLGRAEKLIVSISTTEANKPQSAHIPQIYEKLLIATHLLPAAHDLRRRTLPQIKSNPRVHHGIHEEHQRLAALPQPENSHDQLALVATIEKLQALL